jgi:hypothetical protein
MSTSLEGSWLRGWKDFRAVPERYILADRARAT